MGLSGSFRVLSKTVLPLDNSENVICDAVIQKMHCVRAPCSVCGRQTRGGCCGSAILISETSVRKSFGILESDVPLALCGGRSSGTARPFSASDMVLKLAH